MYKVHDCVFILKRLGNIVNFYLRARIFSLEVRESFVVTNNSRFEPVIKCLWYIIVQEIYIFISKIGRRFSVYLVVKNEIQFSIPLRKAIY